MSKFLKLGGSGGLILAVAAGVIIWQSCKLAVTHKSLAGVCTFSNQIRNSIGMITMGKIAPTMTPGMLNNTASKGCLCQGGKFVGNCDMAGQPCSAAMTIAASKMPAKKSMLGYTMSRVAGAHDGTY